MLTNGISLVYMGEFNHEITKTFSDLAQKEMDRDGEAGKTKRVVYHALVETLQNMNKHSDEIADSNEVGKGLYLIGKRNDNYYIITSNKIAKDKIEGLELALKQVNSCSKEELKKMYKEQLRCGKLSPKGGAGLGLIDVARKTGRKLHYQFLPIDDNNYLFILKVDIISRKLLRKNSDNCHPTKG